MTASNSKIEVTIVGTPLKESRDQPKMIRYTKDFSNISDETAIAEQSIKYDLSKRFPDHEWHFDVRKIE